MSPSFTVRVAFLDVGQGDTIIISIPETGEAVIVDCVDYRAVFTYLRSQQIKHIRGLIITHLHLDHYKDVIQFLNNCETELQLNCERVIVNWPHYSNQEHLQLLLRDSDNHSDRETNETLNRRKRKNTWEELKSWSNEHVEFCEALTVNNNGKLFEGTINSVIEVLQPWHAQLPTLQDYSLNDTSGILRIYGLQSSALLTGDLEIAGWQELSKHNSRLLRNDVLKFPHHGAWKNANPKDLLDAVQPSIVVISVGSEGDKYHHPNAHVFEALRRWPHLHPLCTQATDQCSVVVNHQRQAIIAQLKTQTQTNHDVIGSNRGCPCAGTIIVELGNQATVIQPQTKFHHETIIKTYFKENHQCVIQ